MLVNGRTNDLEDVPTVSSDDRGAARAAVEHLAALGHERVALVAGPGDVVVTERKRAGWRDGIADARLPRDPDLDIVSAFGFEGGRDAADAVVAARATGVVCGSDVMALGLIQGLRARGLEVPGHVSVVGYDGAGHVAWTDPPLTTSRQHLGALAQAVVRVVMADDPSPRERFIPTQLVVRQSTGPAPRTRGGRIVGIA